MGGSVYFVGLGLLCLGFGVGFFWGVWGFFFKERKEKKLKKKKEVRS